MNQTFKINFSEDSDIGYTCCLCQFCYFMDYKWSEDGPALLSAMPCICMHACISRSCDRW